MKELSFHSGISLSALALVLVAGLAACSSSPEPSSDGETSQDLSTGPGAKLKCAGVFCAPHTHCEEGRGCVPNTPEDGGGLPHPQVHDAGPVPNCSTITCAPHHRCEEFGGRAECVPELSR